MKYVTEQRGQKFDPDGNFSLYFREVTKHFKEETKYRFQFFLPKASAQGDGDLISAWHDIPLHSEEDPTNKVEGNLYIPQFPQPSCF